MALGWRQDTKRGMYIMKSLITLGLAAALLQGIPVMAQDHSQNAPGLFGSFDHDSARKGKKKKRKRKPAQRSTTNAVDRD